MLEFAYLLLFSAALTCYACLWLLCRMCYAQFCCCMPRPAPACGLLLSTLQLTGRLSVLTCGLQLFPARSSSLWLCGSCHAASAGNAVADSLRQIVLCIPCRQRPASQWHPLWPSFLAAAAAVAPRRLCRAPCGAVRSHKWHRASVPPRLRQLAWRQWRRCFLVQPCCCELDACAQPPRGWWCGLLTLPGEDLCPAHGMVPLMAFSCMLLLFSSWRLDDFFRWKKMVLSRCYMLQGLQGHFSSMRLAPEAASQDDPFGRSTFWAA